MAQLSFIVTVISISSMLVFAEELYSDRYDDINVKSIMENEKLRMQYLKCYIETGPCITADARFFKGIFGEAFLTNCKKCTKKQKENMNIFEDWYRKNKPEQWELIVKKSFEDTKKMDQ